MQQRLGNVPSQIKQIKKICNINVGPNKQTWPRVNAPQFAVLQLPLDAHGEAESHRVPPTAENHGDKATWKNTLTKVMLPLLTKRNNKTHNAYLESPVVVPLIVRFSTILVDMFVGKADE